jgi:signal transduction histidine kinase
MRWFDMPRTTGFRVATLVLAVLGIAALSTFLLLYVDMDAFLGRHIDNWILRERGSLLALPSEALEHRVQRHARFDVTSSWPVALYGPDGKWVGGTHVNLPTYFPNGPKPFNFYSVVDGHNDLLRGVVVHLSDNRVLLVSEKLWWARALNHVMMVSGLWALCMSAVLALGVAAAKGSETQRRLTRFTCVVQLIVSGDLSERLPQRSRGDDLDRLAELVNGMLDYIERLILQVGTFRDALAHDLSTPLARLHVTLEGARARARDVNDYRAALDAALAESQRVSAMFAAVRRLSDIEDGARRSGFTPVDLCSLGQQAFDFYQPVGEDRDITLTLEQSDRPCIVQGDRDLLFEALGNMVDNALKFTLRGGTVTIVIYPGDALGFEVIDNGPGIPASERQAVRRRFYRSSASYGVSGSGLGLAIVSAIAELHGMQLVIGSAEPGCRVSVRLTSRGELATKAAVEHAA